MVDCMIFYMLLLGKIVEVLNVRLNLGFFFIDWFIGLVDIFFGLKEVVIDKLVKGIYINFDNVECGYVIVMEICDVIYVFRKLKKFVVVFFNGEVIMMKQYYIVLVVNEVYGFFIFVMEFMGLGVELMYFKGMLDKFGVQMQIICGLNNDFKSVVEFLFLDYMSDSSWVQMMCYMGLFWFDICMVIVIDRKVLVEELNNIVEGMKIQCVEDVVVLKFVDVVKYQDEVVQILCKKVGCKIDELKWMVFEKYVCDKFKVVQ